MKKGVIICLGAAAVLNGASIDGRFGSGKVSGQIRTAYVSNDYDAGGNDYASAIGGILKYETAAWNDTKLGVAAYASRKIDFAIGRGDGLNRDFFDAEGSSFAYVGEAYIDYSANDVGFRIGRQLIDTPLADTDDIRMHPNTFEAAMGSYSGIEGATLTGGYMRRWAGYDAPQGHNDSISAFQKFGENHQSGGAALVGIAYEGIENLAVQWWYYRMDKIANALYADAVYTTRLSETTGIEWIGQIASFSEKNNSGLDGSVYGIGARLRLGMASVEAVYNKASNYEGKFVGNGFGGGPYLTSMEEWTIDGMEDARAYRLSGEIDMGSAGIEGVTLTVLHGAFRSAPLSMRVKESDVILAYRLGEAAAIEASYAEINDLNRNADGGNDAGYSRFLARISYNF